MTSDPEMLCPQENEVDDDASYCSTISLSHSTKCGRTATIITPSSTRSPLQYPRNSTSTINSLISPPLLPPHFPSDSETLLLQFTSHDIIQVGHYVNTIGAFILAIYFTYNNSYRSLQYYQISFVSILLLLLERRHSQYYNYVFLSFGLITGIFWNIVITLLFYHDLTSSSLVMKILSLITTTSSFTLILSWLYYAYYSKPISGDIDLLLYFLAMNIIAFFSADQFNNTLHFLIDIRTYQIIFTASLRLKSKFDLVLSPQFLIIVFLMLVAYVFLSLGADWANFLGFGIYGAIGLLMFTVPIK